MIVNEIKHIRGKQQTEISGKSIDSCSCHKYSSAFHFIYKASHFSRYQPFPMSQLTKTLQEVCSAHSGRSCYGVVIVIHDMARILCEFDPESSIGQLRDTDCVVCQCPVIKYFSQSEATDVHLTCSVVQNTFQN